MSSHTRSRTEQGTSRAARQPVTAYSACVLPHVSASCIPTWNLDMVVFCTCRWPHPSAGLIAQRRHHPPPPAVNILLSAAPRSLRVPAAVCCTAARSPTAVQDASASVTTKDEIAGAAVAAANGPQDRRSAVPADVLRHDPAAAARRASGRMASTSHGGGDVEPVAVAHCHTLPAEVRGSLHATANKSTCTGPRRCKRQGCCGGLGYVSIVLHKDRLTRGRRLLPRCPLARL